MQFYKVTGHGYDLPPAYVGTLAEAHVKMKTAAGNFQREVLTELVDIATDKATLCFILSGESAAEKVLRSWELTPRNGLKEITNGE